MLKSNLFKFIFSYAVEKNHVKWDLLEWKIKKLIFNYPQLLLFFFKYNLTITCQIINVINIIMLSVSFTQFWSVEAAFQWVNAPPPFSILTVNLTNPDCSLTIFSVLFIIVIFLFVFVKKPEWNLVFCLKIQSILHYIILV